MTRLESAITRLGCDNTPRVHGGYRCVYPEKEGDGVGLAGAPEADVVRVKALLERGAACLQVDIP